MATTAEDLETRLNASATGRHLLLGSLVTPVADTDPTLETRGIADGQVAAWVESGRMYIAIFSSAVGGWTVLGEEAVGTIKPYAGAAADIPRGWFLCDGDNGTYDLRGYFILGSALEDAGVATDATSAVLANHTVTPPGDHNVSLSSGGPSGTATITDDGTSQVAVASSNHTHDVGFIVSHSTSVDAHVFTSEATPASFTLAFIQKIS